MGQHVKIKIGNGSWDGKIEAEFEASDEVITLLKKIILQNFYVVH